MGKIIHLFGDFISCIYLGKYFLQLKSPTKYSFQYFQWQFLHCSTVLHSVILCAEYTVVHIQMLYKSTSASFEKKKLNFFIVST